MEDGGAFAPESQAENEEKEMRERRTCDDDAVFPSGASNSIFAATFSSMIFMKSDSRARPGVRARRRQPPSRSGRKYFYFLFINLLEQIFSVKELDGGEKSLRCPSGGQLIVFEARIRREQKFR